VGVFLFTTMEVLVNGTPIVLLHSKIGGLVTWCVTQDLLEIVNSALKLVDSPLLANSFLVASKAFLTWIVCNAHPEATANYAYAVM
jgi:hypothetical protein